MTHDSLSALYGRLLLVAVVMTAVVIVLGAYTRLSDAGLGCPDWPGCYGALTVPADPEKVAAANAAFPERPVDTAKAWAEMIHRYFASGLGLIVLVVAAVAWRRYQRGAADVPVLPSLLVALVVFQGLLGMWTVTLLLKPAVVMSHLLGGLTTLALLWWAFLRHGDRLQPVAASAGSDLRGWALAALAVVYLQIALGGWTSANYAALACTDFPTCHGQWWPAMDFAEGFVLWRGIGINYEFGILESPARTAIHVTHRLGAVITFLVVGGLALRLLAPSRAPRLRGIGAALLGLLLIQVSLGIANVLFGLPLPVAVAHNAGGAALLLGVVTLNHVVNPATATVGGVHARGAVT